MSSHNEYALRRSDERFNSTPKQLSLGCCNKWKINEKLKLTQHKTIIEFSPPPEDARPFFLFSTSSYENSDSHFFSITFLSVFAFFAPSLISLLWKKERKPSVWWNGGAKWKLFFYQLIHCFSTIVVLCYCCVFQHIFHRHEIHASVVSSSILYSLSPRLCDPFSHRLVFASRVDSEDEKVPPKFIVFTLILIHWDLVYIYFRIFASSTRRNVRVSSQKTVCESCVSIIK